MDFSALCTGLDASLKKSDDPSLSDTDAARLSRRLRPALMAFFMRRLRDHAEAEDLTQEVLLRISQHATTLDPERPDAYVFRVAVNLLRDRARRASVRTSYLTALTATAPDYESRDPERVLQGRDALATVVAALNSLPDRTRTIFVLFRLENMKQREIALALGLSLRTVEQHVVRAAVHLRQQLRDSE